MKRPLLRGGFVLAELVAACAVVVVLAAMVLVWAGEARRQGSLGENLANLKRIGEGTGAYGADNDDLVWGFSWRAGVDYGFGGVADDDREAAANQAIEIIRRRTGRTDIGTMIAWVPHVYYSTLALADYLDEELPARWMASPEDRLLLLWQSDPEEGYYALGPTERPFPLGEDNAGKRWPYSSSYELGSAFWSHDAVAAGQYTVSQATLYNRWNTAPGSLHRRRLSEVSFPGQKAMVYERYQRHFGPRHAYFMHPEARIPILAADGGAAVRKTSDTNRGFEPNSPANPLPTPVIYQPDQWEPPTILGGVAESVFGYYRWTRSGLRGRDFGGPEVPWVD